MARRLRRGGWRRRRSGCRCQRSNIQ
jgi:hypothetical protein